jgi:hypothetical protein
VTLLYTEISPEFPQHGRCVFFAADRRITASGGGQPRHHKKLIDIPYLNSALGFFGLAEFKRGQKVYRLADHLRYFVRQQHAVKNLTEFAARLADSLNSFVPSSLQRSERSGIHVAGIASQNLPEFWFVRNVDDTGHPALGKYEPREDFLRRDARAHGFDGKDPKTLPSNGRLYRNGDIVSHVVAWEALDDTLGRILSIPQFLGVHTPEDYAKWIRFKMQVITHFHKQFATTLLVGGQIDVIINASMSPNPTFDRSAKRQDQLVRVALCAPAPGQCER